MTRTPSLTDTEHREIALAIAEGRAVTSANVPHDMWPLIFLPLAFMDKRQLKQLEKDDDVRAIVGIIGKHKTIPGRALNGYHMFTQCQMLGAKDWEAVATYANEFIETRKAMLKKPDKPKLPRAPLPRQTGGIHKTRKKELPRKAKHKKRAVEE